MCKNYYNVLNAPLFTSLPNDTLIMQISPIPSLHILIGIFNHIWKAMENTSQECKDACHKFALENNCIKEDYWGKTFEGNECVKLMKNISHKSFQDYLQIKPHVNALQKFNILRKSVFGNTVSPDWHESYINFCAFFQEIPNITKPLKVHIVFAHLPFFINNFSKGRDLGYFSEQTGESIHQKFNPICERYKLKNIESEKYGNHLLRSVIDFSSSNI